MYKQKRNAFSEGAQFAKRTNENLILEIGNQLERLHLACA